MPSSTYFSAHNRHTVLHPYIRPFFLVFCVYLIGIYPILRANRLYLDDIGRALYGYSDWSAAARPVADLLSFLFFLNPGAIDASPFTQIIAACFLAAASLILCTAFKIPLRWDTLLCTVPIGLSPYGFENLSYKFDSPWMALAMLLAILPFVWYRDKRKFFITSCVCLFISASIYQAALSFYISAGIFTMLAHITSKKKAKVVLRDFFWILLPFCVTTALYAVQAQFWFRDDRYASYVAQHNILPVLSRLPLAVAENITDFADILWTDWTQNSLGLLLGILICLFAATLAMRLGSNATRLGGRQLILRVLLLYIAIPSFFLSPLSIQILLEEPVWSPRTFCSFGLVIAFMLLHVQAAAKRKPLGAAFRIVHLCIVLQLIIFSQVYGNLLAAQNNWERNRIAGLAHGLSQYIAVTDSTVINFAGSIGQTPLLLVPGRYYPLLQRMVAVPLTRQWCWGYEQLKLFGIYVSPGRAVAPSELTSLFLDTPNYTIHITDDGIGVVTFKNF